MTSKRALLIGVSEYGEGLKSLKAPLNDVATLARVLQDPSLGQFDQVSRLLNPDPQTLREAIEELFYTSQRDDLVLLFFSGHGLKDDRNRLYFATRLTRKTPRGDLVKSTAVPASFIQDQMIESPSRRQIVMLDCCFSGAFAEGMTAKDDGKVDLRVELGGRGRVVLTSSTSTQYAFEQNGSDLSIYTAHIVNGIETGAADADGDGYTAIDELHDYACHELEKAASAMQPKIYAFDQGFKIHIAKAPTADLRHRHAEVATLMLQGKLSVIEQYVLNRLRDRLGLSAAAAMEAELLMPRRNSDEKRRTYRDAVEMAVAHEWPLSDRTQGELTRLQLLLGLTSQDTTAIHQQVEHMGAVGHINLDGVVPAKPSASAPSLARQPVSYRTATVTLARPGLLGFRKPVLTVERNVLSGEGVSEDLGHGVTLTLMTIAAGTFTMGSSPLEDGHWDGEGPQHAVTLASFYLSQSVVTQAQWKAVTTYPRVDMDLSSMPVGPSKTNLAFRPIDRCPATHVSWLEAVEFCRRLSQRTGRTYRLPSEAEWEYACRAGTVTPFHVGSVLTPDFANYDGNYAYGSGPKGEYRGHVTEVGTFPANALGIYDMHGNVWEWCADQWHESYVGAPVDGSVWQNEDAGSPSLAGFERHYVIRGGSWMDGPSNCRSASRLGLGASIRSGDLGFRVVCELSETA